MYLVCMVIYGIDGTHERELREPMVGGYAYAAVEKALAAVFSIDLATRKGAFRGRIQNLQRLGLAPKWPGKGRTVTYNDAAVWAWMIALEAEEFGVEPQMIARLVK